MRFLIALVLFMSATQVSARMVLLTSFEKDKEQKQVESLFRKKIALRAGEQLQVVHKTDQWTLFQTLQDPQVEAVFWLSHGVSGSADQTVDGATLLPKLLDYRGDNVAPVFARLGQQLKFIAIVGCNSAAILEHYRVDVSSLAHYIPTKKKVALHLQVPKAVDAYRGARLENGAPTLHISAVQGTIHVHRTVTQATSNRSLRVYAGNHLLGLVPAYSADTTFAVPEDTSLKIKLESGQDPTAEQGAFGEILIYSSTITGKWELFKNNAGDPFGVNHRLFVYRN